MATEKQIAKQDRRIVALTRMAERAATTRDAFTSALDAAKGQPGWGAACAAQGVDPHADASDWMRVL